MLTKPELTSPMGAIRYFSALSRGVKVQVLINFFLKLLCQLGVLGAWKKGNCNCVRSYAESVECCQEVDMVASPGDNDRRLHILLQL